MFTDRYHKRYDKLRQPWRFLLMFIPVCILIILLNLGYPIILLLLLILVMDRVRYIEKFKK